MYTIGQVAKQVNMPVSTLRYYDNEGLFPHLVRCSGIRKFSDNEIEALNDEIQELEYEQERPQEVFEWWRVTSYLYEKLGNKGEVVLEGPNGYYWGRCCTGQAILLDGVISQICADNEILEGQEYDWSKRTQL